MSDTHYNGVSVVAREWHVSIADVHNRALQMELSENKCTPSDWFSQIFWASLKCDTQTVLVMLFLCEHDVWFGTCL